MQAILEAGAAAPDHGQLRPFRFTILRDGGLDAFGAVLEEAYVRRCAEHGTTPNAARAQRERTKLARAPLVIVVAAVRQESDKIPWQDQRDATAAAAQNILLAAHALGFGAMWRTGEDVCEDGYVKKALGLSSHDALVGFLYLGTPHERKPAKVLELAELVSEYRA